MTEQTSHAGRKLSRQEISDDVTRLGWRYNLGLIRTSIRVGSLAQAAEVAQAVTALAGDSACGHRARGRFSQLGRVTGTPGCSSRLPLAHTLIRLMLPCTVPVIVPCSHHRHVCPRGSVALVDQRPAENEARQPLSGSGS